MADAAPSAPDTTGDIDTMTERPSLASLTGEADRKATLADLTSLKKKQIGEEEKAISGIDQQMASDKARAEHYFKLEGFGPDNAPKPWDADKEHRKFETDPVQGIGSIGSIFAVLASAFTKAPATNAIQGMAGAINAIKEGNEDAYKRAYDSYKENTKLALERQKIQHEQYQDAVQLMQTNLAAGQAKFHNLAVKFGDQNKLMLLEHGHSEELMQVMDAEAKSAENWAALNEKDMDRHIRLKAYDLSKEEVPPDATPEQKQQIAARNLNAWRKANDIKEDYHSPEQVVTARIVGENPHSSGPELAQKLEEAGIKVGRRPEAELLAEDYRANKIAEIRANGNEPTPAQLAEIDEKAAALAHPGRGGAGGGSASLTNERVINADSEKHKEQMRKEHPDWSEDKLTQDRDDYVKRRKIATKEPTAHDVHQDDVQYAKAERMEGAMDEMDELLARHKFITGVGGTLTRPIEAFSNVLGSNETDRRQFQRIATELKEWGQSVLNDRTSRPLSQEASDAAVVFAGLKPGDTSANTLRAITELRPVIAKIKDQIKARGAGRGPVSGQGSDSEPSVRPAPADNKTAPWLNDPVKDGPGKQSSTSESPPIQGARKAPDGKWYVDDPKRPGKYLQVQNA